MDHKVSKDMISSGMIPSGEKTQSDLGRTQYGSAPSPSKLMDAYKSMYKEENIDEALGDGGTKPAAGKMYRVKSGAEGGSRQVKSTYGKPQEGSFITRQKEKLEAQRAGTDVQGLKDKKAKELEAAKDRVARANAPRSGIDPRKGKAPVRQMDARNLSNPKFEDVDLLAAYNAVYEHHKKDADGNTIPHEDEEIDEAVISGTLAALKLLGTKAAKLGVKAATKFGGKGAANVVKNVARNPMGAIDNINRVGYAAQTVGNLIPKPSVPAVTKKQNPQGGMISADVDLFDIVKGQLLDEGYSEKEVNEIMVNLTEEQLEEFLKQLATRAAQYGANIGREGSATGFLNQRADKKKVLPVKDQPVKGAADVVKAVSAADKPKPTREKLNPKQKAIRKEITDKMKKPTPLTPGKGFISANPIRRKQGEVMQDNADLFDIVKGQLLDEGMSEEEIKDIMLTLTPDEILNEISGELAMKASKAADMKRGELARSGDKAGAADKAAQASRLYKKGAERNIAKQDLSKPLNPQRTDYPMGKGANYRQKPGM
jgi:hypothetical protein